MTCFKDCIHYEECEHQEPNLCGVAAPCSCFPAGPDDCPICGGKIWIYPTVECPGDGYPGPAVLLVADLSDEQMTMFLAWRNRDEEQAALGRVEE